MTRATKTGVSQLELLIALAVMALVAVLVTGSLETTRRATETAENLSEQMDEMIEREALRRLAEDMPLIATLEEGRFYFRGTSRSIQFATIVTDGTFWMGDLVYIAVDLVATESGSAIKVFRSGRNPRNRGSKSFDTTLAHDVKTLKVSYFGVQSGERRAEWHEDWDDGRNVPQLAKLEFELENGRSLPPLTFVPAKNQLQRYMSLSSLVPPG